MWEDKVDSLQKEYPNKQLEEIKEFVSYFIAPPMKSMHATGGAVDALIYDLKDDSVMDFGTNDGLTIELNDKCYPYHPFIPLQAKKNRKLLIDLLDSPLSQKLRKRLSSNTDINIFIHRNHTGGRFPFPRQT